VVCLKTNPTGSNDDERVQQASRHDLARALAPRYTHASRRQKGQLLDEFCAITGYTRKHALVMLSRPPVEDRARSVGGRPPSYGSAEVALLRMCWSATDGICSKRLAPFLPELLARLRHWHALRHVSAETIERVAHISPSTIEHSRRPGAGLPQTRHQHDSAGHAAQAPGGDQDLRRLDRDGARLCRSRSGRSLWMDWRWRWRRMSSAAMARIAGGRSG